MVDVPVFVVAPEIVVNQISYTLKLNTEILTVRASIKLQNAKYLSRDLVLL